MTAAIIVIIILAVLAILQLALVFKAPIGEFAWGGQHKVLPGKLRAGSAAAIVIYIFIAAVVAAESGWWHGVGNQVVVDIGIWVIVGYFALGVFVNAISRSKKERNTMTPVSLVLAVCTLLVAL